MLPPLIVLLFFVGGIAGVNLGLKRRVRSERAEFRSEAIGLRRERHDLFGLAGYPFALFSRCREASIDDVRWGGWRGLDVKRIDLTCATTSGEWARFACAIAPTGPAIVPLIIEAGVWETLLGEPPFGAVDLGRGEAERPYVVRCDDPAFARALVGPGMPRWLDGLEEPWGFEVHGSLAMVYGPPSAGVEARLERLQAFAELTAAAVAPSATGVVPAPARRLFAGCRGVGGAERSVVA